MKRIVLVIVGILGVFGVVLLFGKEEKEQVYLTNKEIKESNYIAVMVEQEDGKYQEEDSIPQKGYVLNTEKSKCNNGTIPTWENNKLKLSNLTSDNTSCYLYFEIAPSKKVVTKLDLEINENTPINFGVTACDEGTNTRENPPNCESTDKGLYKGEDDDGETYYFRGSVNNNWVKFAGYYWRIIRINGDGTIRLIYTGKDDQIGLTFPNNNKDDPVVVTGAGTQIDNTDTSSKTYPFNSNSNDNKYVGFMYGGVKNISDSSSYDNAHTNTNNSDILDTLYSWYDKHLSSYSSYIDGNAGFCGDRTPYSGSRATATVNYKDYGYGLITTFYGADYRLSPNNDSQPTFKCLKDITTKTNLADNNDLYTLNNNDANNKGNKKLTKPIGLITADEVMYAGGAILDNIGYWLYTAYEYWTMSPSSLAHTDDNARVYTIESSGDFYGSYVSHSYGIRPVINLKADTKFTTSSDENKGTFSNPYVVEGAN